jgi:hypothetical protein
VRSYQGTVVDSRFPCRYDPPDLDPAAAGSPTGDRPR